MLKQLFKKKSKEQNEAGKLELADMGIPKNSQGKTHINDVMFDLSMALDAFLIMDQRDTPEEGTLSASESTDNSPADEVAPIFTFLQAVQAKRAADDRREEQAEQEENPCKKCPTH